MAQITSREELEAWLKDKPAEWAQVIAARAALRVLPYAFAEWTPQKWVNDYALALIRATAISWAARNLPAHDMGKAAHSAGRVASAASRAAHTASRVANAYAIAAFASGATAYASDANAVTSSRASTHAVAAAISAVTATRIATGAFVGFVAADLSNIAAIWANINYDCERLADSGFWASRRLTHEPLWPAGEPEGWSEAQIFAYKRLAALDQGYDIWSEWYHLRIEGHDMAFAIHGEVGRTEDKKILARLADATNEDFWDKGATYVNTTLKSWIDEARERAAIDYVASGAPLDLGSDAELIARGELTSRLASVEDALAALKDQLASLTQTGHGGIGHNQPENATSLRDDEIITLKQQVASLETLLTEVQTQLAKPVPDVGQLVQDMPKLNRWGRAMCVMADMSSEKVAEGFEKEIGAAGARGLINIGKALVYTALCAFLLFFYTVWIPLLIG